MLHSEPRATCPVFSGDDDTSLGRRLLITARHLNLLHCEGETWQALAERHGVSVSTLDNWRALLKLIPALQTMLSAGTLDPSEAYCLARVPQSQQWRVFAATRREPTVALRVAAIRRAS